ncbi:MAG TPA: hypothetical protein VGD64_03370 [Acidisarcina sp.]
MRKLSAILALVVALVAFAAAAYSVFNEPPDELRSASLVIARSEGTADALLSDEDARSTSRKVEMVVGAGFLIAALALFAKTPQASATS